MAFFSTGPRHRASTRSVLTSLAVSSGAVVVGIVVAVSASGGTFALWSSSQTVNAGVVDSGSTGLTINSGSTVALDGAAWSTLLPGDSVQKQVTLVNTGTVSVAVSATTTGSFSPLLVHVKKGACGTTITGTSSTVSPTAIGTFTAGESSAVCIQVSLPTTTPTTAQGSSQSFTVTISAAAGS